MKEFLKIVAEGYKMRYENISSLTFVMPNKRSETFLLKEFSDLCKVPTLSPRILPITDFIAGISNLVVDSRIDLLFRLYNCFIALDRQNAHLPFEKFSSWGETILNDFNDIDMQMADPSEIFKNVYDLNKIRSNFLSPAHKKVMVNYFGYPEEILNEEFIKSLWLKFENFSKDLTCGKSDLKTKYHKIWSQLGNLYESLHENLESEGLTTQAGAYRNAALKLQSGFEPFPGEKIIFVGFNALSEAESTIFRELKDMEVDLGNGKESKADFIWDKVSPVFSDIDDPASRFISVNSDKDNFPAPEWIDTKLERSFSSNSPEIKVVSVPSNVMQAKIAGNELERWGKEMHEEKKEEELKNAKIAVVLPDENMLLPMLYSLPQDFSHPNLTMGFPLRQTPVVGFTSLLRRLYQGALRTGKKDLFFFSDVKDFVSHPYCQLLFDRASINEFIKNYEKKRRLVVTAKALEQLGKFASEVFLSFDDRTYPVKILDYVLHLVNTIKELTSSEKNSIFLKAHVEKVYLSSFMDALIKLRHCMEEYRFTMSPIDVFSLIDKIISNEKVVFKGEPLEGLQIMGLLETRCLDFDKVIILSMNEKIMPRIGRNTSFIPNIIRMAFNMPPANYQQEIFAYYFFRLLSRCSEAVLTYDSRSSDNRTPGVSRYVLQMKYLTEDVSINEEEAQFVMPKALGDNVAIEKSQTLQDAVDCFNPDDEKVESLGIRNVSASSLKDYFSCPVKFLYKDILKLYMEKEQIESIDASDLGTIVHKGIERLYFPEGKRGQLLAMPIIISSEKIRQLLNEVNPRGETAIEREARRAILETHFSMTEEESPNGKLSGSSEILLEFIVVYIKYILQEDLKHAPFRLWGSEIKKLLPYVLPDGHKIQFKMVIDRLDQEGVSDVNAPFRVVDYKTGKAHLSAKSFCEVFDGTLEASNIFQLLFYAELLIYSVKTGKVNLPSEVDKERFEQNLKLAIYEITSLPKGDGVVNPCIGKEIGADGKECVREIENMGDFRRFEEESGNYFFPALEETLQKILTETSFEAKANDERCKFCDYKLRCKLVRAKEEDELESAKNS